MKPTSTAQYDAMMAGTVPEPEIIREGVSVVALPLPGGLVANTLTYLIEDSAGAVHVVDPGWDSDENWASLVAALALTGRSVDDVASMLVSHLHPDHLGMAERLRNASGATVVMHRLEDAALQRQLDNPTEYGDPELMVEWGVPEDFRDRLSEFKQIARVVPGARADLLVDDDEVLPIVGREVRTVFTPGHTVGHLSFRDVGEKLLYTGDHVLPMVKPGLGLGGFSESSPIGDYLASLDRVAVFDDDEVLPGHEYRFTGIAERAKQLGDHHRKRSTEIAALLAAGSPPVVWELASRISWTAGWGNLEGLYLQSALAQTAMHLRYLETA